MIRFKYLELIRLLSNERCSQQRLKQIQNVKLKRLISHAYENVAFYRNKFEQAGLNGGDFRSIEDLGKFPIIDKTDLQNIDVSEWLDRRVQNINRLIPIRTSGSSGFPLSFYIDRNYDQIRKAQCLRPYITNGRGLTDKLVQLSATSHVPKVKWFQHLGLMQQKQIFTGTSPSQQLELINRLKPEIIQGYGSSLVLLASKILSEGQPVHTPRMVFSDSELLTTHMRRSIEKGFNAQVLDVYGSFETDNIAYECHQHKGYHISADTVIMEFIKDGKRVLPEEEGEIVCTVLDNYTMPFIRYNLHDIAVPSDRPCVCGRSFPLMSMICGRTYDYAIAVDKSLRSPANFLAKFDALADFAYEFQVIQQAIDQFEVLIVPSNLFRDNIKEMIRQLITEEFPHTTVRVNLVSRIERGQSGKFSAFISKVSRDECK